MIATDINLENTLKSFSTHELNRFLLEAFIWRTQSLLRRSGLLVINAHSMQTLLHHWCVGAPALLLLLLLLAVHTWDVITDAGATTRVTAETLEQLFRLSRINGSQSTASNFASSDHISILRVITSSRSTATGLKYHCQVSNAHCTSQ